MADFVRKNMMLVIFLGITAVAAVVLVIMDIDRYYNIGGSIEKIEADGQKIQDINDTGREAPGEFKDNPEWTEEKREEEFAKWNKNRRDTRIVSGNADLILQDAAELKQKTWETQRIYGHAYDHAFGKFLNVLKSAQDEKVKEIFADLNIRSAQKKLEDCVKGKPFTRYSKDEQAKLFLDLRNEICKAPRSVKDAKEKAAAESEAAALFDKAFAEFAKEVQSMTVEDFQNTTLGNPAQSLFLQVLGIPRFFNDSAMYSAYVDKLAGELVEKQAIPGKTRKLADWQIRNILMGYQKDNQQVQPPPPQDNIPAYMTRIQIFENIFAQMKKAGLSDLDYLTPEGEVMGERIGNDYRAYSFKISVSGTLPEIRKFLNGLHQAYRENRVYRMNNLVLERLDSISKDSSGRRTAAADAAKSGEITLSVSVIEKFIGIADRREKLEADKKAGKVVAGNDKQQLKDETEDPDYGAVSFGVNDQIAATFDFDYVIYTGDMITETKTK